MCCALYWRIGSAFGQGRHLVGARVDEAVDFCIADAAVLHHGLLAHHNNDGVRDFATGLCGRIFQRRVFGR